jgi:hypothetical protein
MRAHPHNVLVVPEYTERQIKQGDQGVMPAVQR